MFDKYHYVYRITNTKENKHYYGLRTTKGGTLPKDDIGVRYFSSSTDECFRSDQKANPGDYKYKVIRICETREEAAQLEMDLHKRLDVKVNPNFFNKANSTSSGFSIYGTTPTQETRDKLSAAQQNRSPEEEAKRITKIKSTLRNKSIEERALTLSKRMATNRNKSAKEKLSLLIKRRANYQNRSIEAKAITSAKLSTAWHSKSTKEKSSISDKLSRNYHNKSLEEKSLIAAGISAGHQNRSPEAKAITAAWKSIASSGASNGKAILINIYNPEDVIQFGCHGNFEKICQENNLPLAYLKKCYMKKLSGFKRSNRNNKYFEKYIHCAGWYARKLEYRQST